MVTVHGDSNEQHTLAGPAGLRDDARAPACAGKQHQQHQQHAPRATPVPQRPINSGHDELTQTGDEQGGRPQLGQ